MISKAYVWFVSFLSILSVLGFCAVGCGGDDSSEDGARKDTMTFHTEASPLSDFAYDTGLVPPASPAQVQLQFSVGGGLKLDTVAALRDGEFVGRSGGSFAIDFRLLFKGRLKIDSPLSKIDGDIPGLDAIDFPIAASVPVDSLLLAEGEQAEVTANVPETRLPEIPLGSVPGSLALTVEKESVVTSKVHGTCIDTTDGKARYLGVAETSGTLVLKGTLMLKLPPPLDKSIDLPTITIPIAPVVTVTESEPVSVKGLGDRKQGACAASNDGGSDAGLPEGGEQDVGLPEGGGTDVVNEDTVLPDSAKDTAVEAEQDVGNPTQTRVLVGTLASSLPASYGGQPYCHYSMILSDIRITLTQDDTGAIISGDVSNMAKESTTTPACEGTTIAPNQHLYIVDGPATKANGGNPIFMGVAGNQPWTELTMILTNKTTSQPKAYVVWRRADASHVLLAWEIRETIVLHEK